MLRRIQTIILFSCLMSGYGWAQTAFVDGIILDAKTKEPLTGVNIVADVTAGTTSDQDGAYRLEVPPGTYTFVYQYIGYETYQQAVELAAGETLRLNIDLKETAILGETVVVSAGKFEQSLGEVTVSMEVLKPNLIENRNTADLTDVMQQTPGVIIVDSEPQIRSGSGYSFGAGSRVMTLIDDLPILSGDAGRPTWGFMPVENVTQVEVIKGASSVLYGSSALNGVINLRTAYPTDVPKTKINFFTGIYSDPSVDGAKYWEITPTITSASFLHSRIIGSTDFTVGGNFLTDQAHVGPPINLPDRGEAETRGRFNINLRYRPKGIPELDFGVNANYQQGVSLGTFIWKDANEGLYRPFDLVFGPDTVSATTRTKQTILTIDPFITYTTPKGTRQSLKGRYFSLENDNTNEQGNSSEVFYGEYQFQQHFEPLTGWKQFTMTAGLVGQHTTGTAQLFEGNADTSGQNTAKNFAGYLQLDKVFWNRLTASGGARFEHFDINGETESKTIFRAGLNYRLGNSTYFRTSYGQGFRFPTIAEKFIRTTVGGIPIYPNPNIESESGWSAEAGVKHNFRISKFNGYVDAAYFHQEYDGFIEFTFGSPGSPSDPLFGLGFQSLNTGKSRVNGGEISVAGGGKIGNVNFNTLTGYTYTNPVSLTPDFVYGENGESYNTTSSDTTGNILKYRMQHLVRADLELSYNRWLTGISFRYNSFMKNIDQIFLTLDMGLLPTGITEWREKNNKGDYVFDVRLGYDTGRGMVTLVVNNLLNRAYTIRPLKIEKSRTITLQYSVTF